ncbi:MAG: hydrogenase 4 subunit F [Coriobacteriaceae bacterium]|jgi:hydrogenase-4 component F|nr:hydrogenase 4 subunit F [Coriobacteriaceae bacterium]
MTGELLIILMLVPLAAGIVIAILPSREGLIKAYAALHGINVVAVLALSFAAIAGVVGSGEIATALGGWFRLDQLSCIFVGLIGFIGCMTGLYAISYIGHDVRRGAMTAGKVKQFYLFFSLFIFTMLVAALSNNIFMMWVAVEATTLSTIFLVGAYDAKPSLEAAWKYAIVCMSGVAFGLYGTVLVYANAASILPDPSQAAFWTAILPYAGQFDKLTVALAFVFVTVGFGTKAGLFPMHTWLPDAHSEAPSPVSGLLSGVLLKCAMLLIIRYYILACEALGGTFPKTIMLVIGILSVAVAALSVFSQDDIKRKLAYHSVENIGIVALFLGFGGPLGIAAALLHCVTHGLTKAFLFCLSGNVLMKYGTRDLNKMGGLIKAMPATGVLLALGFFALAGFPPFAMFVSEVSGIVAGVADGQWVVLVIFVIALTIVVAACAHVVTAAVFGKVPDHVEKGDVGFAALLPEVVLAVTLLWFGVAAPQPMLQCVEDATGIVTQSSTEALHETPVVNILFSQTDAASAGTIVER